MVREFIFKGKSKKTGEWVYGQYISFLKDSFDDEEPVYAIITGYLATTSSIVECCIEEIDENTLCQFTGFYDINHVCIFEGDIVKSDMWGDGIAIYKNGRFYITKSEKTYEVYMLQSNNLAVIGNIYDDV